MASEMSESGADGKTVEEDDEEETIGERLWGLTEMFPESVRNITAYIVESTILFVTGTYTLTRKMLWVLCSSSVLLFAPIIIEVERLNIKESAISQQKEFLFGTTPYCVTTPK